MRNLHLFWLQIRKTVSAEVCINPLGSSSSIQPFVSRGTITLPKQRPKYKQLEISVIFTLMVYCLLNKTGSAIPGKRIVVLSSWFVAVIINLTEPAGSFVQLKSALGHWRSFPYVEVYNVSLLHPERRGFS